MAEERGGLQQSVEFLLNHLILFFWHLEPQNRDSVHTNARKESNNKKTVTQGQIKTRIMGSKVKVPYTCASFTLQVCQKMGVEEVDKRRERQH